MSNDLIQSIGQLPSYLSAYAADMGTLEELSEGIAPSFNSVSVRGKVFRFKVGGEEHPFLDANTRAPSPSLDCVIVASNPKLSKTFYKGKYQENSDEAPDCASSNGITPDSNILEPQSQNCATCPKAQWGSAVNEATGKPAKACQDAKRIAIATLGSNGVNTDSLYMLSIPPASLKLLLMYSKTLQSASVPFNGVVTRLQFDINTSYPMLHFSHVRLLSEAEFSRVLKAAADPATSILVGKTSEPVTIPAPPQQAAPQPTFAPPQQAAPQPSQDPYNLGPDSRGDFWNPDIHSAGQSKLKDGTWRAKRGSESESQPSVAPASAPAPQPQTSFAPPPGAPVVPAASTETEAMLADIIKNLG